MQATYLKNTDLIIPNEIDALMAKETSRRLTASLGKQTKYWIQLHESDHPDEILAVPTAAMHLLADVLSEMADGNAVTITPVQAELSTQKAADLLNVSRPFLVRLLEDGKIPFYRVGTHRRIKFNDLMKYKEQIDAQRLNTLAELAEQAQRLDMGY